MSRVLYGGSPADVTTDGVGRVIPNAQLTVWSARTGGTQYTDLQTVDNQPAQFVVSDSDGLVLFYGPSHVTDSLWLQSAEDRPRLLVRTVQLVGDAETLPANVDLSLLRATWNDGGTLEPHAIIRDEDTLYLGLPDGGRVALGQEHVLRVRNNTGGPIGKGRLVACVGVQGDQILAARYDTSMDPKTVLGIASQNIPPQARGAVVTSGYLTGLDTSAFTDGAVLWASSTPGFLTATEPTSGTKVCVALVVRAGPGGSGSMYVRVIPGQTLDGLSGVSATATTGQVLVKQADASWAPSDVAAAIASGSITPAQLDRAYAESGNTFVRIGEEAGAAITGSTSVAIGRKSLKSQALPNDVVAIGEHALEFGDDIKQGVIAIGGNAGRTSSPGRYSTAVGYGAMEFAPDGAENAVAVGQGAQRRASKTNSVAVGNVAQARASGIESVAVGFGAQAATFLMQGGTEYTNLPLDPTRQYFVEGDNLLIDGVAWPNGFFDFGTGTESSITADAGTLAVRIYQLDDDSTPPPIGGPGQTPPRDYHTVIGANSTTDHPGGIALGHNAYADTARQVQIGTATPIFGLEPPNALRVGVHDAILTTDTPTTGDVLRFDGTNWVMSTAATAAQGALADGAVQAGTATTKGDLFVATAPGVVTRLPAPAADDTYVGDPDSSTGYRAVPNAASGNLLRRNIATATTHLGTTDGFSSTSLTATLSSDTETFFADGERSLRAVANNAGAVTVHMAAVGGSLSAPTGISQANGFIPVTPGEVIHAEFRINHTDATAVWVLRAYFYTGAGAIISNPQTPTFTGAQSWTRLALDTTVPATAAWVFVSAFRASGQDGSQTNFARIGLWRGAGGTWRPTGTDIDDANTRLKPGDPSVVQLYNPSTPGFFDVVAGTDARLSDARTPTAHKSTHATGGSDPLTPADIGAATTAQGAKADTALQPAALAAYDTGGDLTPNQRSGGDALASTHGWAVQSGGGTIAYSTGEAFRGLGSIRATLSGSTAFLFVGLTPIAGRVIPYDRFTLAFRVKSAEAFGAQVRAQWRDDDGNSVGSVIAGSTVTMTGGWDEVAITLTTRPAGASRLNVFAGTLSAPSGTEFYIDLPLITPTLGTASAEDVGAFATAAQGALAETALQSGDFATAAQGALADTAIQPGIVQAKGDLIVGTANGVVARLAAPANGRAWVADSAQASGFRAVDIPINLLTDAQSGFEDGSTVWAITGGPGNVASNTNDDTHAHRGARSNKITSSATGGIQAFQTGLGADTGIPVMPGETYTGSFFLRASHADNCNCILFWYSGTTLLSTVTSGDIPAPTTEFRRYQVTGVAPPTATQVFVCFRRAPGGTTGADFWLDSAQVNRGPGGLFAPSGFQIVGLGTRTNPANTAQVQIWNEATSAWVTA